MKSAHYNVRDRDGKSKHYLVVYDETAPCALCGLPVGGASVSATAICGDCDCGRPRVPEWKIRQRRQTKVSPEEAWGNKTQDFLFDTREEADAKMYELHQQGIDGWPHVIKRMEQPST